MPSQLNSSVFQRKGKTVNIFDIDFKKRKWNELKNVWKPIRLVPHLRNPGWEKSSSLITPDLASMKF